MIGVTSISYKTCGYMIPVDNSDSQNIILTFEMPFGSRIMCGNCTIENETSLISDGKLTKTENGYFIEKAIPNLKITRSKSNVSPLTILRGRELLYCDNTNKVINLSVPVWCSNAVVFDNNIHVLVGADNTVHYMYDGVNWNKASTLPFNANRSKAIVFNNELHLFSGADSQTGNYHYKWNGIEWTQLDNLPFTESRIAVIVHNKQIHIIGPFTATGSTPKTCHHYILNNGIWENISTLPFFLNFGTAVSYNGKIHAFGNGSNHYSWDGTTWTKLTDLPINFSTEYGCAVVYNNELHILGGVGNSNKHYKWNTANSTWDDVSTLPFNPYRSSAIVFDNKIHLISSYKNTDTNKYYSWDGTTWRNSKRVSIFNVPMGTRVNKILCTTTGENLVEEKSSYLIEL